MKNNKCFFKDIFFVLLIIIFSIVSSFLIKNFELWQNYKEKNKVVALENQLLSYNCKDKICLIKEEEELNFDFENLYIKNFEFNYLTEEPVKWTMKITEEDIYGKLVVNAREGISNEYIDVFAEKIDNVVTNISIKFDNSIKISDAIINNNYEFKTGLFVFIFSLALCIYVIISKKEFLRKKTEYLFLAIAVPVGMILLFSVPNIVGVSWDEQIHFANTYNLFQGRKSEDTQAVSLTKNGVISNFAFYNTDIEKQAYYKYLNDNNDEIVSGEVVRNSNFISYNQFSYIPMAIAFNVSNVLGLPFTTSFLMGRFINYLMYLVIIYFAIKLMPIYKKTLLVVACIPTSLFLASRYSYDSWVMCLMLLGMAVFVKEMNSDKKISLKNMIIFILSIVLASFPKALYIPLLLLILFLPKEKFENKDQKKYFKIGIILITLLVMATFLAPLLTNSMSGDVRGGDTSVTNQLKLILSQPFSFCKVLYTSAFKDFFNSLNNNFNYMSYISNINIDRNINMIFMLLIIMVTLFDNSKAKSIKAIKKLGIFMITFFIFCFIWGALYLSFTYVGSDTIIGVQMRYFFPLIFPFLLLFKTKKVSNSFSTNIKYYFVSFLLIIVEFLTLYYNINH